MDPALRDAPHRRWNPLSREWVLVSPHRTKRPWQGSQEEVAEGRPPYDPACYLCPDNQRAGGVQNPGYKGTFVFDNDFAALLPSPPEAPAFSEGLLLADPVQGTCRVVCFSPRHDLTLADMDEADIRAVVDLWAAQVEELGRLYPWVQVFENKGAVMGCSNPHPHGQIWASSFVPQFIQVEDAAQREHFAQSGAPLLAEYLAQELALGDRVVCQNEHWAWLVPFWAVWPYEVLLLPKRPARQLYDLSEDERAALAAIMKNGLGRFDRLFRCSFPYSMGWHGAPLTGESQEPWVLHAHYYPPLLRSASVKKFMVGYEMLAESQRDITAEQAAETLRSL